MIRYEFGLNALAGIHLLLTKGEQNGNENAICVLMPLRAFIFF